MRHQVTCTIDRCIKDLQEKNAVHAKYRRPTDVSTEAVTKIFERPLEDERDRREDKKLSENPKKLCTESVERGQGEGRRDNMPRAMVANCG